MDSMKSLHGHHTKEWLNWLPVVPFMVVCLGVMLLPLVFMLTGSFTSADGEFTLEHYANTAAPVYARSFKNSILLSGMTAVLGTVIGTVVGYFICRLRSPRAQELIMTLCDVTANFSGAPLAFAFVVILGGSGVLTMALERYLGWSLYPTFTVYSFAGLVLAYTYFQLPLMVLLVIPAIVGLRRDWREAAMGLGATSRQYWLYIGLPILGPTIGADMLLLFANAFGAYATAYTLTEFRYSLVTLQIGFLLTGEVLRDPGAGDAMGIMTLALMGLIIFLYQVGSRRSRRWQT